MDRRQFIQASIATSMMGAGIADAASGNSISTQPAIVLVHGTWHGGWMWGSVSALLRAQGFRVYTPTCTGCGERVHLSSPEVGLDTHINDIVNVIRFEELENVVLVGHSYAGLTITGVADQMRDRIRHIVFFDALIPREGVMSGVKRDPDTGELPQAWHDYAKKFVDGYKMDFWQSYPAKMLVPETEVEIIAKLKRLLTTHPAKQWTDILTLKNGGWEGLPRSYIHCVGQTFKMSSERMTAPARQPGWQFLPLAIPRNGMMTHPQLVANTLATIARETPRRDTKG